ncbi:MAG: TonB-dependent receptor, partial [Chitinophagaceae bacterium]
DATGPLPMVNVAVKGTSVTTQSDISGEYSIQAAPNAVLVFTYIGYATTEMPVNGQEVVNVSMAEDAQSLKEVVVTGYVGQSKSSISGAVAQVDLEDMSRTRVADVTQALQGQVAGVVVSSATGAPGDGSEIRIRGVGTLLASNDPLYVVDGVPTRNITFLNQNDIKNITVLKDAASASIYGSRAAGGVVLITTRKGTASAKGSIDVDVFTGVHYATNLPKMLNTAQYLDVHEQAWATSYPDANQSDNPYTALRGRSDLADTNWLDELFTTGMSTNVQLSASGATDKVQYMISGGYYDLDGVVKEKNDRYKRVNFRTNINANVTDRFSAGTNLQLTYVTQDKLSSRGDAPGVIRHALLRPSAIAVFKDPSDPTWSANDPYTDLPFYTAPTGAGTGWSNALEYSSNPLAIVHFTDDKRNYFQAFGNVYAEYAFLNDKSLKFRSNLGADIKFTHNKNFAENYGDENQVVSPTDPLFGMGRNNRPNSLNEDRGQDVTFTWSNTLNYNKTFGDHSINALLGSEYITSKAAAIGGARRLYDNTTGPYRYLDFGYVGDMTNGYFPYSGGGASEWTLFSYFASATYGFKNKYFLTGTMRADASSRFGPNNKWGYFPSVAGNWTVTNESFMEQQNVFSNLKLRASWGKNGNQEIPNNAFDTFISTNEFGVAVQRFGNPDIQWETTTQTNFGLDLGFLNNKLNISADYFNKKTDDILLTIELPPSTVGQIDRTFVNAGSVVNKGFEFLINYQDNDGDFKYGVTANFATLDNEVTHLQERVNVLGDLNAPYRTEVGRPINSYYGYQFIGVYQNEAEIDTHLFADAGTTRPGDMKFADRNGDGQINPDDRTFIGNPVPKMTYGLSFNAAYKGFDFSFMLQGVQDVDRYNDLKKIIDYDSRPFNSTTAVLGAWNGEGTSNTIPRNALDDNGGSRISSAFVEDASYLRLKNIEIGYTFGKNLPKSLTGLRIYVSGQNLLTWSDYYGLDPESTDLIDMGTYPQASAVLFGARLKI